MQRVGIVLCGGRSSRMGWPKAMLPFGPESMLQRVVRLLREVVEEVVVVAAPGQELPSLPSEVQVVRDRREGRGPLEGLSAGLAAIHPKAVAFATSCDVPLLVPALVRRMFELLGDEQVAVPHVEGYHHPLAAVYRAAVREPIEALLAADRLRPVFLFEQVPTRVVMAAELTDVDPQLDSLRNCNRPEDYLAAMKLAGFSASPEILQRLGRPLGDP